MKITHLTAHLGGGIGNALSTLCEYTPQTSSSVRRQVICLEVPEKRQFLERIESAGVEVVVAPSPDEICRIVSDSDIVQVEFWNHPATLEALYSMRSIPIRLVVWSHIAGVYNPIIPKKLVTSADAFVVTSRSSLNADSISGCGRPIDFVCSAGGMERLPSIERSAYSGEPCRFAYVGTTNFTKMNPAYVRYIAGVGIPNFKISIFGDERNRTELEKQCMELGRPDLLDFRGYSENIITELRQIDILVYLLNRDHYGTAEIALIEAMAMGVVPIVLDNPVETGIVENGISGVVATTPKEVVAAVEMLAADTRRRLMLSEAAKTYARALYTGEKMAREFSEIYGRVLQEAKRQVAFEDIFGATPDEWFLSCQRNRSLYEGRAQIQGPIKRELIPELYETTKGSVTHFSHYFPVNDQLRRWKDSIASLEVHDL